MKRILSFSLVMLIQIVKVKSLVPVLLRSKYSLVRLSTKIYSQKSTEKNKVVESPITKRNVDYSAWYNDVIAAADMMDQSPVRGCMVIKPWGMAVWDLLRSELDTRIKDSGAENAYFPLFIPKSFLSKEAEHVDGFAKECAVVTHHRLCTSPDGKSLIVDPDAELDEPLIVRPTSETIIWNMFAKWITSHRDLPLKINQWANVVRWEMRNRPFLRSTEFLWQEGHTAHATSDDAVKTARDMLDTYASVCEDLLAMPTIKGRKSPSERFAGADDTFTIEALMQNGWALQSGTSHFLGQNFARAFDVYYQNEEGGRELVWATSWGVSTRLIGAVIMTHSDDKGLVLPPPVAPLQVIIVPITKGSGEDHETVIAKAKELMSTFKKQGIRCKVDDRPNMRPGAKYFEWERKGVPLRLEIGARDLTAGTVTVAIRTTGLKATVALTGDLSAEIRTMLAGVHGDLLRAATERLEARTIPLSSYEDMKKIIASNERSDGTEDSGGAASPTSESSPPSPTSSSPPSTSGFYLVPWKCDAANEAAIKTECRATIRCYPFSENVTPPAAGTKCFYSGDQATHMAIFARAF